MTDQLVSALLQLAGVLIGGVITVLVANKLVNHRIEAMEKKSARWDAAAERMPFVERDLSELKPVLMTVRDDVLIIKAQTKKE